MSRILLGTLTLIFLPLLAFADGGTLYITPERAEHALGDVFTVQVHVDSGGESINAAEAEIEFNSDAVEVVDFSTDNSLLEVWPTPPVFSNADGYVRFSGLTNKPYIGKDGLLLSIRFRALRNMSSNARFAAGAILAADGQGSNIISNMRSSVFAIQPKEIVPKVKATDVIVPNAPIVPLPPVFSDYDPLIRLGGRIVVKGTASPNATVAIYYAHGDEGATRADVKSAADGTFTFAANSEAKEGMYHLYARVTNGEGMQSEKSQSVTIEVGGEGLVASAAASADVANQLMPYAALLVFAGLAGGYLLHRHRVAIRRNG